MTQYSYNGWLASANRTDFGGLDNREVPGAPGVHLAPGVRNGDVATVLFYVAAQLHKRVEAGTLYAAGDEWGYSFRPNKNDSSTISCHGSATAFDWNATKHPNGKAGTFTKAQVAEIRKILAEVNGVVAWGGDFKLTKDEMHWEISGDAAAVKAAAQKVSAPPVVRPMAPAPAAPTSGRPTVKQGSTGQAVKDLQARLNRDYSAYSRLTVDGSFGPSTNAVVREFQRRAGLVQDGIVGPNTWAKLGL